MKTKQEPFDATFDDKRLRVIDLMTPWFWIVCFYQPRIYGEAWFILEIFEGQFTPKWWWNFWIWERKPSSVGMEHWQPLSTEEEAAKGEPLE